MIYMTHPLHGAMNVGTPEAALEQEKFGWKRDIWKPKGQIFAEATAEQGQAPADNPDEAPDESYDVDVLRCAYEEKHGAPADYRWGARRLRKEIG